MPWQDDIDQTAPTDVEFVSEGAMRFRELKRALIERLATAYKGFPGENPDRAGEDLLFPIASVRVGTQAQRPNVPEREGAGWFSTDTKVLYIADRNLVWQSTDAGVFIPALPLMKARKAEEQTVSPDTGEVELIQFAASEIDYQDNGTFFDANISTTGFRIPEAGRYLINARVRLLGTLSRFDLHLFVNEQRLVTGPSIHEGGSFYSASVHFQRGFSEGNEIEFGVSVVNSTGDQTIVHEGHVLGWELSDHTGIEIAKLDTPQVGTAPPQEEEDEDEYDEYEYDEYV